MEEDMIKIEELEYFNPFVDINLQLLDLKNPNVFSCNFDEQQQLFIYMACSDDIKAKIISQIRPPQIILNRLMYPSKEELNNQYPMYKKSFTKRDVKKLNNVIKKFKTKIDISTCLSVSIISLLLLSINSDNWLFTVVIFFSSI